MRRVKIQLGDSLVKAKLINEEQLQEALKIQKKQKSSRLGSILVELGFITENDLTKFLGDQLGINTVNAIGGTIDRTLISLIPQNIAINYSIFPLKKEQGKVVVAMSDPLNVVALDDIEAITALDVEPVAAPASAIKNAIEKYYGIKGMQESEMPVESSISAEVASPVKFLEDLIGEMADYNSAFSYFIKEKDDFVTVIKTDDGAVRWKVISEDFFKTILEKAKDTSPGHPLTGIYGTTYRYSFEDRKDNYNVYISSLSTVDGERFFIKREESNVRSISDLGINGAVLEQFREIINGRQGLLLVCGGRGNGISTTLYSIMNYLKNSHLNIISLEKEIRKNLDKVCQVELKVNIKFGIESTIDKLAGYYPDVLVVDEYPSVQQLTSCIRHLRKNNIFCCGAVRVDDDRKFFEEIAGMSLMDIDFISGILKQRIFRRICEECVEPVAPESGETDKLRNILGETREMSFYRGKGCGSCNNTGFKGRTAVFGLTKINRDFRDVIIREGFSMPAFWEDIRRKIHGGLVYYGDIIEYYSKNQNSI